MSFFESSSAERKSVAHEAHAYRLASKRGEAIGRIRVPRMGVNMILVNGTDVITLPPYRRNLGMVFQNYALFPHMTVAENIAFPLRMRRLSRSEIEVRVQRMLDRLDEETGLWERI